MPLVRAFERGAQDIFVTLLAHNDYALVANRENFLPHIPDPRQKM